jgi:alkanesulfonate monooxygenase
MPLLPLASNAQPKARGVNTGPFGETIGGDKRPVKQVSAS